MHNNSVELQSKQSAQLSTFSNKQILKQYLIKTATAISKLCTMTRTILLLYCIFLTNISSIASEKEKATIIFQKVNEQQFIIYEKIDK